ncbi:MAG TPA: flagellar hook-associated protein FlgL, partial [Methylophaga sp.]|nr:flagellar hook-associated protein FlgL [Methylophaga sp.]
MRISTNQIFDQNLTAMLNQQSALANTQNQLSTGKKIINPSDDPAGSVQILNLQREFSLTEQYLANANAASTKLREEEIALQSATDIIQRIRELAVQGLNDTNTQPDRQAIAGEIKQLNLQLLGLANTRDANGDYLFAGFASGNQPYESLNGEYQGDEGQRNLKVGASVLVATNDPGDKVFEAAVYRTEVIASGNGNLRITDTSNSAANFADITFTYNDLTQQYNVSDGTNSVNIDSSSGQRFRLDELNSNFPSIQVELNGNPATGDIITISREVTPQQTLFKTIDNFAMALEANSVGPDNSPNNGEFLKNIDVGLQNIIDTRAQVGSRINAIEQQQAINDSVSFNLEKSLSEIRDLDYAEAISQLTRQSIGL